MTFALICMLGAVVFLLGLSQSDPQNRNGASVSFLQICLARIHRWLLSHPNFALVVLAYPRVQLTADLANRQRGIEKLVWVRLLVMSAVALITEGFLTLMPTSTFVSALRVVTVLYVVLLQFTLLLSLLRPLFGAVVDPLTMSLDLETARKRTPMIPAPRRSLLMALVNFFEILIAWAIIYRCLMPENVTSMDQANYYSVVTVTTLGYGDINAGNRLLVQLAVTANMIVFLVFSICHITTIMGAMSSGTDFEETSGSRDDKT